MTSERFNHLALQLAEVIKNLSEEDSYKIGVLIRKELDREYRRGLVEGFKTAKDKK